MVTFLGNALVDGWIGRREMTTGHISIYVQGKDNSNQKGGGSSEGQGMEGDGGKQKQTDVVDLERSISSSGKNN